MNNLVQKLRADKERLEAAQKELYALERSCTTAQRKHMHELAAECRSLREDLLGYGVRV